MTKRIKNVPNRGKSKYNKEKCISCKNKPALDSRGVVCKKGYCQKCWGLLIKPEHLRNKRYTRKEYDLTKCINYSVCGNPPLLYSMKDRPNPIAHRKGMCKLCWNDYLRSKYSPEKSKQKYQKLKAKRISFGGKTIETIADEFITITANKFELAKNAGIDIQLFDKTLANLKEDGHILDYSVDNITKVVTIKASKGSAISKLLKKD